MQPTGVVRDAVLNIGYGYCLVYCFHGDNGIEQGNNTSCITSLGPVSAKVLSLETNLSSLINLATICLLHA